MKSLWVSLFLLCSTLLLRGQNEEQSHESIWPGLAHHISVSNGLGRDAAFGDLIAAFGLEYSVQLQVSPQVYAGVRTGIQWPEPGAGYALLPAQLAAKWLPEPTQHHPWYVYGSGGYAFGWFLHGNENVNRVQGGWGGELGLGRLWRVGTSTWISTSLGYLRQQSRIEYFDFWVGDAATLTNTTTMNRIQWRFGLFF